MHKWNRHGTTAIGCHSPAFWNCLHLIIAAFGINLRPRLLHYFQRRILM